MAKEKLEKKSQAESLEPIDQLRQSFVEIEKKRKKLIKEEFSDIDGLKEVVEDQSLEALEALVGDVERLASHKALKGKDKVIVKEIANRIQLIDNNRIDARVGMYKKDYAKIFVKKAIQEEIVKPDADLGRIARLSLDVNGLKAVNDLNGGNHTPGDEYLDLAANVIKSEKVLAWGKENNIKIAFSKDGGDSFSIKD
ncbi:MAG: hypothetical protein NT091_00995 [Candidatus Falkowbacteria bacterium]|nr:hypothetical protein [Candidatus Falkowbacteria bacterium]